MHLRIAQPKFLLALVVTMIGTCLSAFAINSELLYGIDDANITQVYARNLSEGLGYVYYSGGERVEGSTSFAWTMLNTVCFLLPGDAYVWLHVLSFVLALATIYFAFVMAISLARMTNASESMTRATLAVLILCCPSLFAWQVWSLMDTVLWVFVVTASCVAAFKYLRENKGLYGLLALIALAVLTRPEGIAYVFGLSLLLTVALILCEQSWKRVSGVAITCLAVSFSTFALITYWRMAYFGHPFPNTYYAKVSDNFLETILAGLKYVIFGVADLKLYALGLAAWVGMCLTALVAKNRLQIACFGLPLCIIGGVISIAALTGGDHFSDQRFLQPALLIALVGLATNLALLIKVSSGLRSYNNSALLGLVGLVLIVCFNMSYARESRWYKNESRSIYREFKISESGRQLGATLNELAKVQGEFSVAVIAAGGVPLIFRGQVYDLLGLNWKEMAHADMRKIGIRNHASFNADVFYRAMPDIIPIGLEVGAFVNTVTKGLFEDARFRNSYSPVSFNMSNRILTVYARNDWVKKLTYANYQRHSWSEVKVLPAYE